LEDDLMDPNSQSGERRFSHDGLAIVLASGRGARLGGLTAAQTKAAIPFGGHYRAIDFTLSNCVNSQIRRIAVLTQYKSQSLILHIQRGWGFLHREVGEFIEVWPAQQQDGERWYGGTVDAVYQNIDLLEAAKPSYVLVVAGDQIHSLDYSLMAERHLSSGADLTVACIDLPLAEAAELDVAVTRPDGRIVLVDSRAQASRVMPGPEGAWLVPMGVYLFSTQFLLERLRESAGRSADLDFARDIVPAAVRDAVVYAHESRDGNVPGYWRDIGTVDRYWRAHMELLRDPAPVAFDDPDWPVFTRREPLGPGQLRPGARVDAAIVTSGCVVAGEVSRSVLSTGVRVAEGASIRNSVLLPGANVGEGAVLDRVVVGSGCTIPPYASLSANGGSDRGYPVSPQGVLLVTAARSAPAPLPVRKSA
jgi:glucose-1-phosphate adenylyltransferase